MRATGEKIDDEGEDIEKEDSDSLHISLFSELFTQVSENANNITVKHKLCELKGKTISTAKNSKSNFRTHLKVT